MRDAFDNRDIKQIEAMGLTVVEVEKQLDNFREGFGFLPVSRAAVVNDGILRLSDNEISIFKHNFDALQSQLDIEKFVPASGAATRMFKDLFEFLNTEQENANSAKLLDNIEKFAFYDHLQEVIGGSSDARATVSGIVDKEGLDYGSKPKALLLFHAYPEGNRTALEEHLVEGAMYAGGKSGVKIHFTVSPEHLSGFKELIAEKLPYYEAKFKTTYNISYSSQKSSTDTIAVTPDNEPFRDAQGSLIFRPAGHGSLLENLNSIDADIIFIKTIDNVTTDRLKGDTVKFKKVLAGLLLALQKEISTHISSLESNSDETTIKEATSFIEDRLGVKLSSNFGLMPAIDKVELLLNLLDRPVRVCGMVRNEGEPGGGPFWAKGDDAVESLQIAESSQISPDRADLMFEATHFNPVDIVCGVRDYNGNKYDLKMFVDPSTGFISNKSKDGKELKAQELPGLWNGSMANWNTVFVEVPISTFTPVKVVTDLLREQHQ